MQTIQALTSDFPSTACPAVVELIHSAGRNPRVAWVAPQASSRLWRLPLARRQFRRYGVETLEFIDAGRPLAGTTSPFSGCDLVYLTGGDPLRFRQALLASGLDRHIRTFAAAGGPIVAASGGAMQLTPNVSLFRLLKSSAEEVLRTRAEFDGIGLVQFEILPHLERHSAPFLARVSRYSQAIAHDVVALADGAALIFQHGTLQYVGAVMRYRAGVSTPLAP